MKHKLKDPGSAITHFIGMLMAIFHSIDHQELFKR